MNDTLEDRLNVGRQTSMGPALMHSSDYHVCWVCHTQGGCVRPGLGFTFRQLVHVRYVRAGLCRIHGPEVLGR